MHVSYVLGSSLGNSLMITVWLTLTSSSGLRTNLVSQCVIILIAVLDKRTVQRRGNSYGNVNDMFCAEEH